MNIADLSIKRPVVAAMLIAAVMVFGLISYPKVGVDLYPEVDFPVVTVTVAYPGADPETMERNVAEPVEDAVSTMGGIRSLKSINADGVTQVITEFDLEVSADDAVQDIRDRISRIASRLPEGAEAPIVDKFDIGAMPIMTLALAGELPRRELTQIADKLVKTRVQQISGVGGVDIVGGRDRQIQVLIDPARLAGVGLTVDDVANAIRSQNVEVPAGRFNNGTRELSVKTKGELSTASEIGDIALASASVPNLRVTDVAEVVDGTEEARSASFLNGSPAISLVIRKQSGSNTVAVADHVRAVVEELRAETEKRGVTLTIPSDNSVYIARSIHDVQFDLVFGGLLAVLVIFIFLMNWRATLISAVAIPTSVVATFAFISVMDFTFNNMTMLALSLAIGILVDDAIVVIENIHRHLERGKTALAAASDATREIFLAVVAMTSTIIAVFVPVAVMKGIVGRFFLEFGLTVSFAVAMSMLVSFTLTPMLASRLLQRDVESRGWFAQRLDHALDWLGRKYGGVIGWSLSHRGATLGVASVALIASAGMVTQVKTEFTPTEDRAAFSVDIELPPGSTLDQTTHAAETVASDLRSHLPGVETTLTAIGGGAQGQAERASIQVGLVSAKKRKSSQQALMSWVRSRYSALEGAKLSVGEASASGGSAAPVQLNIRGNDIDELVVAAEALRAELTKIEGFVDVELSFEGGKPELALDVDRESAASLNVPVSAIGNTVRALLAGDPVSEIKDGGDAYDIVVRLSDVERKRITTLSDLKVRAASGELVDLANVVRVHHGSGPSQIDREARQRQVTVSANLDGLALGEASQHVEKAAAATVPKHLTIGFGGSTQIMEESFGYMIEALLLAIVLVYMILAAQFNSFIQPITIMISLPLSVIGAFGALYLTGMTLSIFSMIGVIMLMGLVTKNAILLVDFTNQLRESGASVRDALIEAGTLRLRPILMTALSMIFGMLPVALAVSEGGEARAPMAVCVIGGLITSTLLTLVVVPVVYTLVESLGDNRLTRWAQQHVLAKTDAAPGSVAS